MRPSYVIAISDEECGDLVVYRDAVFTWAACTRAQGSLALWMSPSIGEDLAWLGVTGQLVDGPVRGARTFRDPSRASIEGEGSFLHYSPLWAKVASPSLQMLREEGFLAEAVFASLVRSSYGPDKSDFFPSRTELATYFDESKFKTGGGRWDALSLDQCQDFFLEELTPEELIRGAMECMAAIERQRLQPAVARWHRELSSVAFLLASELSRLSSLGQILNSLLTSSEPLEDLLSLLERVAAWCPDDFRMAWEQIPSAYREAFAQTFCPGFESHTREIFFTLGPAFLRWRALGGSVLR